ncbi:unnamed protein product [Arabis nemorensis]|uniref:Uncharacterized protein n=1 Tax=Arabis nemorensis TaxID=586526 RepID=A0A565CMI1_9BRAS|nr:unnamed protein product [Arabis nemorensis]
MGAPAAPVSHPDNQQAAAWVAGDNQQMQQQPYIVYSPVEHRPNNNPLEPVIGMFNTWSRKAGDNYIEWPILLFCSRPNITNRLLQLTIA